MPVSRRWLNLKSDSSRNVGRLYLASHSAGEIDREQSPTRAEVPVFSILSPTSAHPKPAPKVYASTNPTHA